MCANCDWEGTLEQIEEALDSGDYDWAEDTLTGIKTWVKENEHVTPKQERAVANIILRSR